MEKLHKTNTVKETEPDLIKEVNDFIEKERKALEESLFQHKREAEDWRVKYSDLVERVSTNITTTGDYRYLEVVGEVDEKGSEESNIYDRVEALLGTNTMPELDLSNVEFDTAFMALFAKDFSKMKLCSHLSTVKFSGCSLTDEHLNLLSVFISNPRIVCFDLSNNNFEERFAAGLLNILQNRRSSPHYLLLDGNMSNKFGEVLKQELLPLLTDATWGITLTLQDFPPTAIENTTGSRSHHKGSTGTTTTTGTSALGGSSDIYHHHSRHEHKSCFEFLLSLTHHYDPALADAMNSNTKSKQKKQSKEAAKKSATTNKNSSKSSKDALEHQGLQLLTVFGLPYSRFSKQALGQLQVFLEQSTATLTDLDLSFSYIGYVGAVVIGTALSNRHCQFIRVGLAGNALGERGVAQLASALEANTTLTTLDIRSNGLCGFGGLGDSGFGITALQQSLSTSGCRQLYRLDLRGNHFSQDDMIRFESCLLNVGRHLNVIWNVAHRHNNSSVGSNILGVVDDTVLYTHQKRESVPFSRSMSLSQFKIALLHSIDLKVWNTRFQHHFQHSLEATWSVRASNHMPFSGDSNSRGNTATTSNNRPPIVAELSELQDSLLAQQQSIICGEVACLVVVRLPSGEVEYHQPVYLSPGTCLLHPMTGYSEWVTCKAILPVPLPPQGHIEIYALRPISGDYYSSSGAMSDSLRANTTSNTIGRNIDSKSNRSSLSETRLQKPANNNNMSRKNDMKSIEIIDVSVRALPNNNNNNSNSSSCTIGIPNNRVTSNAIESHWSEFEYLSCLPKNHSVITQLKWIGDKSSSSNNLITLSFELKMSILSAHNGLSSNNNSNSSNSSNSNSNDREAAVSYDWTVSVCKGNSPVESIASGDSLSNNAKKVTDTNSNNDNDNDISGSKSALAGWKWQQFQVTMPPLQPNAIIVVSGVVSTNKYGTNVSSSSNSNKIILQARNCCFNINNNTGFDLCGQEICTQFIHNCINLNLA